MQSPPGSELIRWRLLRRYAPRNDNGIYILPASTTHNCAVHIRLSSDASHITHPSTEGPSLAMQRALADGGIEPARVGYINAHGTGTDVNDPTEAAAIRQVFRSHTDQIAVSSTKSMHGHALGAAAAMEAAATVLGMHHRVLPPTANFTELDPAIQLDVIANRARPAEVEYAISNSFAFGGLNATLAFRRV